MDRLTNIPVTDMKLVKNFNNEVALEYCRTQKETEYITHSPSGPVRMKESTAKFDREFFKPCIADGQAYPIERAALKLMLQTRAAYAPGEGVMEVLLEIYTLETTRELTGVRNPSELRGRLGKDGLFKHYNVLAEIVGMPAQKKSFKTISDGLEAVSRVQKVLIDPTEAQASNQEKRNAEIQKRFSNRSSTKESSMATKVKGKVATKAAAKKSAPSKAEVAAKSNGAKPAKEKPTGPRPESKMGKLFARLAKGSASLAQLSEASGYDEPNTRTALGILRGGRAAGGPVNVVLDKAKGTYSIGK